MSFALFAAAFTGLVLGLSFTVDRLEEHCSGRFEAYQECVEKEQDRELCEDRELPWYCE